MQMKKFITLCLSAALLGGALSAEAVTPNEARAMIKEGKALKLRHNGFRSTPTGIKNAPGTTGVSRIDNGRNVNPLAKKAPQRITAGGSEIYAWSVYDVNQTPPGLYQVDESSLSLMWNDPFYTDNEYTLSSGYLKDGKIYGAAVDTFWGMIFAYTQVVWDFQTGEVLSQEELDLNTMPYFGRMAYNPDDDCIYGTGLYAPYDGGATQLLLKAQADDWSQVEVLAELSNESALGAMCYNGVDGCLYGVNSNGEFVRITTEGEMTPLFPLGLESLGFNPGYYFGLIYSPVENVFYANPNAETTSWIITIDPASENVDIQYELAGGNQLAQMFTTDEVVTDPLKPARPSLVRNVFMQGSTSGWNIYEMPTEFADGTPIQGNIKYTALLDGEVYKTGNARPGQQVRVVYRKLNEGPRNFGMYVDVDGHQSNTLSKKVWIGFDTPAAPQNVKIDGDQLTWDAVYSSENGGYVNYSDVTYTVYFNGEIFEGIKGTSWTLDLPEEGDLAVYDAIVLACYRGSESAGTHSNSVIVGQPLTLPYNIVPTAEQAAICSVVDANQDGIRWSYSADNEAFMMGYSAAGVENDDWVILPPFKLENAGRYISMAFDVAIRSTNYPDEEISVYLGTSNDPESMTQCLVEPFQPMDGESNAFQNVSTIFKCEQAGTYYLGFRCTSAPDQMGLLLKNIIVEDNNITDKSPAAVTNLEADAAEEGELSATIGFNMPSKDMLGNDLASDAELVATVSSPVETKTVKGAPGSRQSLDITTMQSMNQISVYVSQGALNSPKETVGVYTGVYVPATPQVTSVTVADDMSSMTIEWDPVTEADEPGAYVGDNITYTTYQGVQSIFGTMWYELESGLTECSYTYSVEEGAPMELAAIGVASFNEAGSTGYLNYGQGLVGTAYTLPIENDFTAGELAISPWMFYRPTEDFTGSWGWIDDLTPFGYEAGLYGLGATGEEGTKAGISIPRFSTKDVENATVVLHFYADCKVTLDAMWVGQGDAENIQLAEFNGEDSPREIEVSLPTELLGKDWVQVNIICEFTGEAQTFAMTYVGVTDQAPQGGTVSVGNVKASTGIFGGKGIITVQGLEGSNVTISNVNGAVVANGVARSNNAVYTLDKGVYVVKAGKKEAKVIVR